MIFPPKLILSFIFLPDEASLKSLTVVEKPPTDDIFPIFFENFVVPYRGPCGFQIRISVVESLFSSLGLQKTEAFTRAGSQRSSWHRVEILAYLSGYRNFLCLDAH
ncbi:uncharacterized protein LOC107851857 [Capsicum annuum]|uniref:uncharacterized protein LOC107851857 n=1 Tax=Capsicum annuum TaxID=4072 RepID=UPI0007BF29B2|nr:uncharacterized protein LOC107851857 [Capsicum annuum]